MDSHSIPRARGGQHRSAESREREQQQVVQYRALVGEANIKIKAQDYSREALDLISQVLSKNPEYYTIWNYRRRILLQLLQVTASDPRSQGQDDNSLLQKDLGFLLPLLKQFPKCYWIWNHRLWLLEQQSALSSHELACKAWRDELGLVSLMLTRDRRNFHGWGYRRTVVERLQRLEDKEHLNPDTEASESIETHQTTDSKRVETKEVQQPPKKSLAEDELQYTMKMIKSDLSNFSAWHARSKLIPQVLQERKASLADRRALFDTELAFVRDALLMDPYDQSLWKYHQYLMFVLLTPQTRKDASFRGDIWLDFTNADRQAVLAVEIRELRELLDDTQDCKWLYQNLLQYAAQYLEVDGGTNIFTTSELREWLARLKELDPIRLGRWDDVQEKMNL